MAQQKHTSSVFRTYGAGRRVVRAALVAAVTAVAGCGISYTSPAVKLNDDESPVNIIELTAETTDEANRSSYTPRSLPDVFFSVAGSGNLRGTGTVPPPPYLPNSTRTKLILDPPPRISAAPYRIGIGDVVLIATRGSASTVEQLAGLLAAQSKRQGYTVRDDGTITIPEVGAIELADMTVEEAEDKLFEKLVANQFDPTLSLEIAEFNSKRVVVGGAVTEPTLVPITLNTLNLGEAITAAGGITVKDEEFASIRIYRDGNLYQIPLSNFRADPSLQQRVLQSGDAIYVDTTYDLDRAFEYYKTQIEVISLRGEARDNALSALATEISLQRAALQERREIFGARLQFDAEDRDYVYLTGEVEKQSRVALPYNRYATLADILYGEGGFDTTTGDPSEIYVLRATAKSDAPSDVTAYHLNAANATNMVLATQLQMRPNDIVFIEEQPITKWARALQQAFPVLLTTAGQALN